jgi:uncharacterized repeat protein (TIGR04076 family)
MKLEPNKIVKIVVSRSKCNLMKKGDTVYFKGPVIDPAKSSPICITALLGIYPWVMASRFGIESSNLEWNNGYKVCCPEKLVEFSITHMLEEG